MRTYIWQEGFLDCDLDGQFRYDTTGGWLVDDFAELHERSDNHPYFVYATPEGMKHATLPPKGILRFHAAQNIAIQLGADEYAATIARYRKEHHRTGTLRLPQIEEALGLEVGPPVGSYADRVEPDVLEEEAPEESTAMPTDIGVRAVPEGAHFEVYLSGGECEDYQARVIHKDTGVERTGTASHRGDAFEVAIKAIFEELARTPERYVRLML